MPDIFTKQKRSQIMSRIHGKNTKPEMSVRKYLFAKGFRYRINDKRYSGKPDIVLPKYKTVIFVHGCFWHGHSCKKGRLPETNKEFWSNKIFVNKQRDKRNKRELEALGWNIIIIWQCEISTKQKLESKMKEVIELITKEIK